MRAREAKIGRYVRATTNISKYPDHTGEIAKIVDKDNDGVVLSFIGDARVYYYFNHEVKLVKVT